MGFHKINVENEFLKIPYIATARRVPKCHPLCGIPICSLTVWQKPLCQYSWGSFCVCAQPMREGVTVTPSLIGWMHTQYDPWFYIAKAGAQYRFVLFLFASKWIYWCSSYTFPLVDCNDFCASLRWCHNGQDGVSNHQPHHCLLNRLFGCR